MPSARSFFLVRFTWLFRAWAFRAWALRRCAHVIFLTAFASSFSFDRRDDNPHERTSAASAVQRSTRQREKATRSSVPTPVPGGALLTKNFRSSGSSTSRATSRWSVSPGRPSAPLTVSITCLHSQMIGPFSPSWTRNRCHGRSRSRGSSGSSSTRRAGRRPRARRGTLRPQPRRFLWYGRVTTRGGSSQPARLRGTFRAGGGSPRAKGLENKAFSRAGASGPGGFTPNMG
jgi:hypothetical protein